MKAGKILLTGLAFSYLLPCDNNHLVDRQAEYEMDRTIKSEIVEIKPLAEMRPAVIWRPLVEYKNGGN